MVTLGPAKAPPDQTYCATVGVQCSQVGDTFVEALPSNHNLVRLGIQVLRLRGKPVTGLSESAFVIISDFVPAGGSTVVKASCTDCFKEADSNKGAYTIFVNPSSGNWESGSYFVQVQVTVPTPNGTRSHLALALALALIDIPFT